MSLHEYQCSKEIVANVYPFYALIMAAMCGADTVNAQKLGEAWPEIWQELLARRGARGGLLLDEIPARRGGKGGPKGIVPGERNRADA